jgi:hypothetical protein
VGREDEGKGATLLHSNVIINKRPVIIGTKNMAAIYNGNKITYSGRDNHRWSSCIDGTTESGLVDAHTIKSQQAPSYNEAGEFTIAYITKDKDGSEKRTLIKILKVLGQYMGQ